MERDPTEMALSTDIVMDIVLSHLKVIDLLSCRLTSKIWNKPASSVLRKRSTMIKKISDKKCLIELEECMEKSSDFPFAGLKFDKPWTLNSGRTTKFFGKFGSRFTRLIVDTHCTRRLDVMVPFMHHLSRLTVLEMALPYSHPPHPRLKFPDSGATLDGGILDLSSLRTLRICCPHVAEDVLGQVLLGTSPSLQIECLNTTPQIFEALKRAGKVQAVSEMKSDLDDENSEYQTKMDEWLYTESPSLTKLDFNTKYGCLSLDGLRKILVSSQQTLKELHLELDVVSMGSKFGDFWNNFPVLAKLTKLSLCIKMEPYLRYLFKGQHGHNFPVLKELKLVDAYSYKYFGTSFSNAPFIVPSVTRIDFKGYVSKHTMKQLAQVFPNVTDIRLKYEYHYSSRDPFGIWSVGAFKCLERLRISTYKVQDPRKNPISMDSLLTGMPAGICNNLRKHEKLDLVNSRWNKLSRDNPSILKLKNLKELMVCLKLEDGLEELPEHPPFMSMVSLWYGLEMMPNIRATFMYKVSLPRSRDEERYKAVLEAALKHVRPYVKLEPFFY